MKKETVYIWIIVLLVLVNALQLGSFVLRSKPPKPPHHAGQDFKQKTIDMLELDTEQAKLFHALAQKHRKMMDSLNDQQAMLTKRYFNTPTETDLKKIETIQAEKINVTNAHFSEVKSILTPQQEKNFKTFKKEALERIMH